MKKQALYMLILTGVILFLALIFLLFSSSKTPQPQGPNASILPQAIKEPTIPYTAETDNYNVVEEIERKNPWISKVPIVTDNFITRYDYGTGTIEIVVYTHGGQVKYSEEDIAEIKKYVNETLSQRGIDLNSVKITARVE